MPLYAFIYILLYFSFILKIVICTYLLILLLIIFILAYLMQKVSYIYFTYHTRASGFIVIYGGLWAIMGDYGGFLGLSGRFGRSYPLNGRFVDDGDGLRARSGAFVRVFPCVRARGCTPTIFRARPIPGRLPPHSVRRICGGISRGVVRVSASECAYCIINRA